MNKLKLYRTYKHYKNKKRYKIVDFCKIQVNDVWVDGVIYISEEDNQKYPTKYTRSYDEFETKFLEV